MKAVCFGEIMLRLTPPGYQKMVQAASFDAVPGGSEANTAVLLAQLGWDTEYVTKLPDNPVGQLLVNSLRAYGVGTSHIVRGGERAGLYFAEKGAGPRSSSVIYDRSNSAIACAKRNEFDWDAILEGADLFHFSGITPALGGELPAICMDALTCARKKGIRVSCDLNYRSKLWSEKKAGDVMSQLLSCVDTLIANEEHMALLFDIRAEHGLPEAEALRAVAKKSAERFGLSDVALTLRRDPSASDSIVGGVLYTNGTFFVSPDREIHAVDRIGSGDAFSGALLYKLLTGSDGHDAICFATAASALAHTIEGDFCPCCKDDIDAIAAGSRPSIRR